MTITGAISEILVLSQADKSPIKRELVDVGNESGEICDISHAKRRKKAKFQRVVKKASTGFDRLSR